MARRTLLFNSGDEHAVSVGPLTGFIELYRLSDYAIGWATPRQLRSDHPNTVISISDLLPAYAIEGDPNRMYPLEDDRHILQQGVRELALLRKVQGEKMKAEVAKGKEKGDVDYADGGQDSGDTGHQ